MADPLEALVPRSVRRDLPEPEGIEPVRELRQVPQDAPAAVAMLSMGAVPLAHRARIAAATLAAQRSEKQATSYGSRHGARLKRFPLRWNHLIEKEALRAKELEHVLIEKVEQLFWNKLQERTQTRAKACVCACRYQGFVRSWHPVRWAASKP